jgi:O-antigen/teichoic acid export membrane protein
MRALELAKRQTTRLRRSELAQNTAKLCTGQGLRLLIQAVYFILIARSLGPKQYGAFVAMASLVAIAVPFAGLGSQIVLLKYVAREREALALYWGNGLLTIAVSGALMSLIILAAAPFFLGREFLLLTVFVCLADLFMIRVADLAVFAFVALGQMGESARINVYVSLTRLLGIIMISTVMHHPTVQEWTIAYMLGAVVCFVYAFARTTVAAGGVKVHPKQALECLPESILYAVSLSSTSIYNDIDKTMVGKLASFTATGIYGAAYRIIDVSLVPVRALLSAAYPEFFRIGVGGPSATKKYAYKLIKRSLPFGLFVAVGLILGAPLIPHILGRNYSSAVEALRWLAIIPFLRCIHIFLADGLTGAGYQGSRTVVQVGVGILNIVLNIFFIRLWSWRGAAWSSVICDIALAITLWAVFQYLTTRKVDALVAESPSHLEGYTEATSTYLADESHHSFAVDR